MKRIATCIKEIKLMDNEFKKGDKVTLEPRVCLHNVIGLMPEYFKVKEINKESQERL